ncbi:MAG: hypothetical protein VZR31_08795 [Lachnospiraceae bacterium]|nr:hypothetical protein [Lachnospiraceae bacterium]
MKYRIVRRWTTKTNKATGEIVEQSDPRFYIQYINFFSIIFEGGWKDLHLFGFNTLEEAKQELDRRLKKKSIKIEKHQEVEVYG